jgi:hypothetical protein
MKTHSLSDRIGFANMKLDVGIKKHLPVGSRYLVKEYFKQNTNG